MRRSESSTAALKAGSSLRNSSAIGSEPSASPTMRYAAGSFELAMMPASRLSSSTKASARPDSSCRKLSRWSLPSTVLYDTLFVRSRLRSSCTAVVPVEADTLRPESWSSVVMPESTLVAMRTSLT
ncbi:Uncharacterised protein [Mycobacterium tuberculosis]|nr:Uncharacterised protein [Mycobacterium tuberculosis]